MMILKKYNLLKSGIISLIVFFLILLLLWLIDSSLILFLLYFPGLFFGFSLYFGLKENSSAENRVKLLILVIISYFLLLLYLNKNLQFLLTFRTVTYGGFGAILILLINQQFTKINFKLSDYFLAFFVGTITTIGSFFPQFNIIYLYLDIVLWQIGIILIINRRLLI